MQVQFRWAAQLAAAALVSLFALALPAKAGMITHVTLHSAPPEGYSGQLINSAWGIDDVALLPDFAKETIYLHPGTDYWVGVEAGAWAFRIIDGQDASGCTSEGCIQGWLNLFFIRDDRGDFPVGFSDPGPYSDIASHFPTAADALAAAQWHSFDVCAIAVCGGTGSGAGELLYLRHRLHRQCWEPDLGHLRGRGPTASPPAACGHSRAAGLVAPRGGLVRPSPGRPPPRRARSVAPASRLARHVG